MSIEDIEQAIKALKIGKIVSCPVIPIGIPGIGAGAEDANDTFGTLVELKVPKSGTITSATYWDLDDEKTQVDLLIFKHKITQIADNALWQPADAAMLHFVTQLDFVGYEDHVDSATFELPNIGKGYSAPEGKFWVQAVCRGTPTIAAGSAPRFQFQIFPDDPDWQEN